MSYQKKCNFCGTFLSEKRKDDATGKWIVKNLDGKPHEYRECKAIQANRPPQQQTSYQPNHQAQAKPVYRSESSTFSRDEEPKATGVTMYSLLIKLSDTKQEVKELRKQIETLASIIDSMAQKQDLMITKIGYPEPKKLEEKMGEPTYIDKDGTKHWTHLTNDKVMTKVEQSRDFKCNSCGNTFNIGVVNREQNKYICNDCFKRGKDLKRDESGIAIKDGQEIKAVQRHLTPEELNNAFKLPTTPTQEVINPMRVPKQSEDLPTITGNDEMSMYWETISEAFVCHNCSGKTHNGFMKLGTKLCEPCKLNVEANESEDVEEDRSDVNNYKPRTIDEINEDL